MYNKKIQFGEKTIYQILFDPHERKNCSDQSTRTYNEVV